MPNLKPPDAYAGTPAMTVLTAGTTLFRIHSKRYPSTSFNSTRSHRYYGGGRFDSTDDDGYGYLYAGETIANAIAETMLRDLPFDDAGARLLPAPKVRGRQLSAVTIGSDLGLVDLRTSPALAQVAQDTWLPWADPRDYPQTRHWGHWIRAQAPAAAGYVWLSKREAVTEAFVLFEDRVAAGVLTDSPTHPDLPTPAARDFDTRQGRRYLRTRLSSYGVTITR